MTFFFFGQVYFNSVFTGRLDSKLSPGSSHAPLNPFLPSGKYTTLSSLFSRNCASLCGWLAQWGQDPWLVYPYAGSRIDQKATVTSYNVDVLLTLFSSGSPCCTPPASTPVSSMWTLSSHFPGSDTPGQGTPHILVSPTPFGLEHLTEGLLLARALPHPTPGFPNIEALPALLGLWHSTAGHPSLLCSGSHSPFHAPVCLDTFLPN